MNILMTESKRRQQTEKARTRTPSSTSDILRDWYGLNAIRILCSLFYRHWEIMIESTGFAIFKVIVKYGKHVAFINKENHKADPDKVNRSPRICGSLN